MDFKIIFFLFNFLTGSYASRCSTCEGIVNKFSDWIEKTAKSNFGGGNTHWEEKSLGSYVYSETRLLEILENVCTDSDKECHLMVEEYEENIENWWFKHFAKGKETLLRSYLCVERVRKACCEQGKWGPVCKSCPKCLGGSQCSGNGTREGTGKCNCSGGHTGDLCGECKEDYFLVKKSEDDVTCVKCHDACEGGCSGTGPEKCEGCKDGWSEKSDGGCEDIDECNTSFWQSSKCDVGKFCLNNEGSFKCVNCNEACATCTNEGDNNCEECAAKHYKDAENRCVRCHQACANSCLDDSAKSCDSCAEGWASNDVEGCVDVDECKTLENPCKDGTYCGNFPGTYHCLNCNAACAKCFGAGPAHCLECASGFTLNEVGLCRKVEEPESKDILKDLNKRLKAATKGSTDFPDISMEDLAKEEKSEIVLEGRDPSNEDKNKKEL